MASDHPRALIGPLEPIVIEILHLRSTLARAGRLLVETVVVPTILLYACIHTVGDFWGLVAVIGWCVFTVLLRRAFSSHVPGTLLLVVGMLLARSVLALSLSSVYVYLLQPIAGSLLMAVLFIGSAAIGRPVTMRLAQDFVTLPPRIFAERRVRQMFTQVCLMWGGSRVLDAALGMLFLRWGIDAGLISRGLLSGLLTVASVVACTYWGWRSLQRMPQVVFRIG